MTAPHKALQRIVKADAEVRATREQRRMAAAERAAAISAARAEDIKVTEIAAVLGVTPERVRQMEAGK